MNDSRLLHDSHEAPKAWHALAAEHWLAPWISLAGPGYGQTADAVDSAWSNTFDQMLHAQMSRATLGISPASLALAFYDWATHFAISPGKWAHLAENGTGKWAKLTHYLPRACLDSACAPCIAPHEQDKRFSDEAWQRWPFNLYSQAFLLQQQWWLNATTSIRGVSPIMSRWCPSWRASCWT